MRDGGESKEYSQVSGLKDGWTIEERDRGRKRWGQHRYQINDISVAKFSEDVIPMSAISFLGLYPISLS